MKILEINDSLQTNTGAPQYSKFTREDTNVATFQNSVQVVEAKGLSTDVQKNLEEEIGKVPTTGKTFWKTTPKLEEVSSQRRLNNFIENNSGVPNTVLTAVVFNDNAVYLKWNSISQPNPANSKQGGMVAYQTGAGEWFVGKNFANFDRDKVDVVVKIKAPMADYTDSRGASIIIKAVNDAAVAEKMKK